MTGKTVLVLVPRTSSVIPSSGPGLRRRSDRAAGYDFAQFSECTQAAGPMVQPPQPAAGHVTPAVDD